MTDKASSNQPQSQKQQVQSQPSQQSQATQSQQQGQAMMTPTRRHPLARRDLGMPSLFRFRDEFDRLFDEFFRGWPTAWGPSERELRWDMDVQDTDDAVLVRAEAPGFEPGDFDLEVNNDQLVMRATHRTQTEEKDRGFREWSRQEFYRSVPLPAGVDADKVEASYRNGVLNIRMPKSEQSKAKRIEVKR